MNSSSLFDAIGVSKVEVLSEDGERLLCRGWRDSGDGDQKAILAVLLSVEHPALGSLSQLTHEFELKDDLHDSWAVQPLELARAHGRTMLVLKDPGGEPLRCLLLGAPMVLERFLRLAVALAAALGHMHKRGIVHKDIKPTNLIVNSATGQIWLTGFGIASRLPHERQRLNLPSSLRERSPIRRPSKPVE